jgi:cohesin loading factor subunit SCC2
MHIVKDDLDFTRYMAENFSAFDYKTQEEVFTVIKYLTSVLSTTGMQLVEILAPSNLLTQLHGPKDVLPTEPVRVDCTNQQAIY